MGKGAKVVDVKGTKYRIMQLGGESAAEVMERFVLGFTTSTMKPGDLKWLRGLLAEQTEVAVVDEAGADQRSHFVKFEMLPGGFDEFFRGKPLDIVLWERAAVEVSFGSLKGFFQVLAELGRAQKDLFDSSSPKAPAGSAGVSSPAPVSTSETPPS